LNLLEIRMTEQVMATYTQDSGPV
jgi:hypothetical protein